MIISKHFSWMHLDQEAAFLNDQAQKGFYLTQVDDQGYHFTQDQKGPSYYLVEYYRHYNRIDSMAHQDQEARLLTSYRTPRGTWAYFVSDRPLFDPNVDDRVDLYSKLKQRIEGFYALIVTSLIFFSLYVIFRGENQAFWLVLLLGILLGLYLIYMDLHVRKEIRIRRKDGQD